MKRTIVLLACILLSGCATFRSETIALSGPIVDAESGKLIYLEARRESVNDENVGTRTYVIMCDPPPTVVCNRFGEVPPPTALPVPRHTAPAAAPEGDAPQPGSSSGRLF